MELTEIISFKGKLKFFVKTYLSTKFYLLSNKV